MICLECSTNTNAELITTIILTPLFLVFYCKFFLFIGRNFGTFSNFFAWVSFSREPINPAKKAIHSEITEICSQCEEFLIVNNDNQCQYFNNEYDCFSVESDSCELKCSFFGEKESEIDE